MTVPVLVVFCKRPALNHGKQRLAAQIGGEAALALAWMFLDCALEDAEAWRGAVVLSPSRHQDEEWASGLLTRESTVVPQPDGNLGERLQAVDRILRNQGHESIIFIGSDAPMLTPLHYESAVVVLKTRDVVLGPASDGGVTLMGSRYPWPDLMRLPWSTVALGAALKSACTVSGLTTGHIPPGYDIDTQEDLGILGKDLKSDSRPARRALSAWLDEYFAIKGSKNSRA